MRIHQNRKGGTKKLVPPLWFVNFVMRGAMMDYSADTGEKLRFFVLAVCDLVDCWQRLP